MEGYVAECTVPADRKTNHAGWWGQEYGLMKLPTVALHYVLTKDHASFEKSVAYLKWLAGTADWTEGGGPAVADTPEAYAKVMEKLKRLGPHDERNSDTTASFTMVGAALTWDWLYNDLDPAFREEFRQALWQHARAMYYGGHKGGNPEGGYWRGVPAYNHRWFRDWGLTLAALGAGEGKPEEQWLLGEVEKELQFMAAWLPADGSQHEGPYYGASSGVLGMALRGLGRFDRYALPRRAVLSGCGDLRAGDLGAGHGRFPVLRRLFHQGGQCRSVLPENSGDV